MASTSMETMILFIAGIVVATAVAGTLTGQVQQISGAIDDTGLDAAEQIRTDVEVISDPSSQVYNRSGNENVTVFVKNTGTEDLNAEPSQVDVLLDGEFRGEVTVTVVDGESWASNNVANLSVSAPDLDSGDHRLKIIVNGDEEVFEFRT